MLSNLIPFAIRYFLSEKSSPTISWLIKTMGMPSAFARFGLLVPLNGNAPYDGVQGVRHCIAPQAKPVP